MPCADPDDQRNARNFERSLREDVLAGRTDLAQLAWFEALPKRVRRSLRLIVETAKCEKAELEQRRSIEKPGQQGRPLQPVPPTNPSLSDIEHNPWAEPGTDVRCDNVLVTTYQRMEPPRVQPRDLSCLRGDAKPWMGIGRRKKRCRAFHAIGQAYVLRRQLALPAVAAAVFTLEQEPEVLPRPDTPPDLRKAVWRLDHSIYGLDGPSTPDIHSLASPEPEPEPKPTLQRPLYPPTPPPIEQIPVQPGELNVFGHDVDPHFAYVVMRGRCAMAPHAAWSLRDAAVSIMAAQYIVPDVLSQLASVLFPAGVHNFDAGVEPHDALLDFCRGWYEIMQ